MSMLEKESPGVDGSKYPADVYARWMNSFAKTPEEAKADLEAQRRLEEVSGAVSKRVTEGIGRIKSQLGQLSQLGQRAGTIILHPKP